MQFSRTGQLVRTCGTLHRLCTTQANQPSAASVAMTNLMNSDWVDTDDNLSKRITEADNIITAYRAKFDPSKPDEATLKEYERLFVAKEAANLSDALGDYVEVLIRKHEDMVGPLGDHPEIPESGADETFQILEDYVKLVNGITDKEIKQKVEMELGRKMVVMRQVLSVHNFSAKLAPVAGYRIVTRTKPED